MTRQRDEEERRRGQAQLVSCWVEDTTTTPFLDDANRPREAVLAAYRNASAEPVYGVSIWIGGLLGDNITEGAVSRDVLTPGESRHDWVDVTFDDENPFGVFVEMYFTDARGIEWKRRGDGVLERDTRERPDSTC